MGDTNKNLDDLAKAAKLKLQAQQNNASAAKEEPEDIYASFRDEMNEEGNSSEIPQFKNPYAEYDDTEDEINIRENEDLLFEGGPSLSQVELWKKKFGEGRVFHIKIIERHFVFRTLYRFEYKQIVAIDNIDSLHREEIICSTVTLWPNKYDFKRMAADDGGYPSTLAQIIMENSGFTKDYAIEVL